MADKHDRAKWHTSQGVLSINGEKFYNWKQAFGGGGAIDLVMHLLAVDFIGAVNWLVNHSGLATPQTPMSVQRHDRSPLRLPRHHPQHLGQVIDYLAGQCCFSKALIQSLIRVGWLYADEHAKAVFLLLGKGKRFAGAEIRGTGFRCWHTMAPGSRKDLDCFSVAHKGSRKIVLCESAIDAMSYTMLDSDCQSHHPFKPGIVEKLTNRLWGLNDHNVAGHTSLSCCDTRFLAVVSAFCMRLWHQYAKEVKG